MPLILLMTFAFCLLAASDKPLLQAHIAQATGAAKVHLRIDVVSS
jgi:hypothetical protein